MIVANDVTNGKITMKGGVRNNVVSGNTMTTAGGSRARQPNNPGGGPSGGGGDLGLELDYVVEVRQLASARQGFA